MDKKEYVEVLKEISIRGWQAHYLDNVKVEALQFAIDNLQEQPREEWCKCEKHLSEKKRIEKVLEQIPFIKSQIREGNRWQQIKQWCEPLGLTDTAFRDYPSETDFLLNEEYWQKQLPFAKNNKCFYCGKQIKSEPHPFQSKLEKARGILFAYFNEHDYELLEDCLIALTPLFEPLERQGQTKKEE